MMRLALMTAHSQAFASGWLDAVLTTGTIGLQLAPELRPWADFLDLTRITEEWRAQGRRLRITSHDTFAIGIDDSANFSFNLQPNNASITFAYSVRFDGPSSDGEASATLESDVVPFSELLPRLLAEATWFLRMISARHERQVVRLGFVANSVLAAKGFPPGVEDLVEAIGQRWGKAPKTCNSRLLVELTRREGQIDQCHHHLEYEDLEEKGGKLTLDWQRIYGKPISSRTSSIEQQVASAAADAYAYLTGFGEGAP